MARKTAQEIEYGLSLHNCTDHHYEHWLGGFKYTDGVRWLAENAEAWWLVDAIATHQPEAMRDRMLREIQFWRLRVREDRSATLTCERDSGDEAIRQEIEFSDFPLGEVKLWLEGGVLMLPTER